MPTVLAVTGALRVLIRQVAAIVVALEVRRTRAEELSLREATPLQTSKAATVPSTQFILSFLVSQRASVKFLQQGRGLKCSTSIIISKRDQCIELVLRDLDRDSFANTLLKSCEVIVEYFLAFGLGQSARAFTRVTCDTILRKFISR